MSLQAAQAPSVAVSEFVFRLLATCVEIRAVWSIDHEPEERSLAPRPYRLLVFAGAATLERLRKCEELHAAGIELCVVTNEDAFESAWGPSRVSGSLARSAWRQTSPREAYYDESRWASSADAGAVVRVRRKALLLWQAAAMARAGMRNGV